MSTSSYIPPSFGIFVLGILERRNLTPTWLACVAGLDGEQVRAVLAGEQSMSRDLGIKIGNALVQPGTSRQGQDLAETLLRAQKTIDFHNRFGFLPDDNVVRFALNLLSRKKGGPQPA